MPKTSNHRRAAKRAPNVRQAAARRSLPAGDALISALIDAASSLCERVPRLEKCRVLAYRDSLPPGLIGAYVPVLANADAIHVGILSDVCSCDSLARSVESPEAGAESCTRTTLCELTRHLAGALMRDAAPTPQFAVGEPVFVDGVARRTRSARVRAVEVVFGIIRATLVVIGSAALVQSDWPGMDKRALLRPGRERA